MKVYESALVACSNAALHKTRKLGHKAVVYKELNRCIIFLVIILNADFVGSVFLKIRSACYGYAVLVDKVYLSVRGRRHTDKNLFHTAVEHKLTEASRLAAETADLEINLEYLAGIFRGNVARGISEGEVFLGVVGVNRITYRLLLCELQP